MTHTNPESIEPEQEIIGWLDVLNWHPKDSDAELRTWLPEVIGQFADRAVFRLDDADRLRRLVDALVKAEYDFREIRLTQEDEELLREQTMRPLEAFWGICGDGRLVLARCEDTSARPFDVAVATFLRIAARSDRWRFNSPCLNCGQYFLRKRRRLTKYHHECRRSESSPRMKAERKRKHDHLLMLARKGIEEYQRYRGRENWKTWVCRYVRQKDDTVIKPKSLPAGSTTKSGVLAAG